jgi:RNA polymerase sigma-70 factor (ECF subfamily)
MNKGEIMGSQELPAHHMRVDENRTNFYHALGSEPVDAEDSGSLNGALLELLGKCLDDSDSALWAEFVRYSRPLIAAVIAKHLRRSGAPALSAADDLVQETYLKLCRNNFKALRSFVYRHEGALHGFLKVIARNVVLDHIRDITSQKRGSSKIECLDEKSIAKAARRNGNTSIERKMLLGKINEFVATATYESDNRRDYTIFWLYYRQGLCARLIARCPGVNLTVKGVESAILRLTKQIREKFNPKRDQWPDGEGIPLRDPNHKRKSVAGNKGYAIQRSFRSLECLNQDTA